jgi:hypothetical protein
VSSENPATSILREEGSLKMQALGSTETLVYGYIPKTVIFIFTFMRTSDLTKWWEDEQIVKQTAIFLAWCLGTETVFTNPDNRIHPSSYSLSLLPPEVN